MVCHSRKLLVVVLAMIFFLPSIDSVAAPKKRVAYRKWVVKLKQNSFMNKRPFQFAAPIVDEEKVYVGIERGIFYGVNAKKGKKVWRYHTQGAIHAQAAVDATTVYVADIKGMVYAINKENGELTWATNVAGEIMSTPLIYKDRLYVVSLLKELTVLSLKSGKILWQRQYGRRDSGFSVRGSSNPIIIRGHLVIGYSDGTLIAHNPESGLVLWRKQLGNQFEEFHDIDATTVLGGELAYVTSADGHLFAFNPNNGNTVWQMAVGGVNSAALDDPYLYVTAGGVVYCFLANTGKILWEQDLNLSEISSPALYGNWLAVVATKGQIYFLNRLNGDIHHSWHVKGGSYADPVIQGNRLYLLSNASRLYSFEFKGIAD